MKIKILAKTDPGNSRDHNEDYFGVDNQRGLVVVCDGMGGHNAGGHASKVAVETFQKMYAALDRATTSQLTQDLKRSEFISAARLIAAIRLANRQLFNESADEPKLRGMGTTLTALEIRNGTAVIGHVGDSRIYRIREQKIELLTQDHTWVNELIEDKEIQPQEAKKFGNRNVITRAIGLEPAVKIDVLLQPMQAEDLFLVCTDGLNKALSDEEIERIVNYNNKNFEHTIQHLIDDANIKDGSDNITVILAHVAKVDTTGNERQSGCLTLKPEKKEIIGLENRLLKNHLHYFSNKITFWETIKNIFKRGQPN